MSTPDTIGWKDSAREASLSQLPDHIQRAIEIAPCRMHQRTNHRHHATGAPHRPAMPPRDPLFYRAVGITYLHSGAGGGPTDWPANLLANPTFTFHLKNGIRADLPARATPAPTQLNVRPCWRPIVADLNPPQDPDTIRPIRLDDWAHSRLMRISFHHRL